MSKFRKKPVEIDAIQWDGTDETSKATRDWAEPAVAIVDTDHIKHLWDYDLGAYIMVLVGGRKNSAPRKCFG